jgi:hypothetical protein
MDGKTADSGMEIDNTYNNAKTLNAELDWLSKVIQARMDHYLSHNDSGKSVDDIPPPKLKVSDSLYAKAVLHYEMTIYERLVLLLAIVPHVRPQLLDVFFLKNATYDRGFTEFGGLRGTHFGGFLPTGETAAFLLAGNDLNMRFNLMHIFERDHYFFRHNILRLQRPGNDEPPLSGQLTLSNEYLGYFTAGVMNKPDFSADFPAKLLKTNLTWDDLVLAEETQKEITELKAWITHGNYILHDLGLTKKIKPGYRCLFHGPPGTGKTLTATLLGIATGLDVYRIDLSMIVSKFIGETEKNLAGVFDMAENKNWILFFDEADALFGKRTQTKDSNDKYANQEVSYLLQRVEDFPGMVILATNLKSNLDDAFARRFQSLVYFPMPEPHERLRLWEKAYEGLPVEKDAGFEEIAQQHEMAGGSIINVLRYSTIWMLENNLKKISRKLIVDGIRKELSKEGRTL